MAFCAFCGRALPEPASFCPSCGAAILQPGGRPAGSPAGTPAQGPAEAPAAYASLGDRLLAVLLDLFVLAAIFWLAGSWLAPRYGGLTPEGFNLTGTPALMVMGLSSLVFFAYYLCFEWWWGATLGKMVVGLKVARADGGQIGLATALVRNLLRIVDGIGVYLVAAIAVLLTKRRQRIGDLAAGTTVHRHGYPGYCRVLAVIALLALPIGAVAASWLLRAQPTGETAPAESSTAAAPAGATSSGGQASSTSAGAGRRAAATLPDASDGPFLLANMRIAAGKDGPARPNATFKAGETPTLLFEVRGFAADQSQQGHIKLTIEALDPDGVPITEPRETEGRPSSSTASVESWANVSLPDYATPGVYRLNITVADLVGARKVRVSAPFTVEGQPFEPSDRLVFRNVRLTEGENGPPRADAKYPAGSTVWLDFEIVGFRVGADNAVRVQQQLTVTTPTGARTLDAQVLNLDRRFFYVPRRLPVSNNIRLGTMPAGDYQATLTVSDLIGGQRAEHLVRFTIQ